MIWWININDLVDQQNDLVDQHNGLVDQRNDVVDQHPVSVESTHGLVVQQRRNGQREAISDKTTAVHEAMTTRSLITHCCDQ